MALNWCGYAPASSNSTTAEKSLNADLKKFKHTKWAVTEKIHGANFCFLVSVDGSIRAGNRRQLIDESSDFFGHKELMERLKDSVLNAFSELKEMKPETANGKKWEILWIGKYPK